MATSKQQISVRVQPYTYEKFKILSEKNNRSISQQIEFLMKQCIEQYENEYGKIAAVVNNNNGNGIFNNEIKM